jgi:hypothetical protein
MRKQKVELDEEFEGEDLLLATRAAKKIAIDINENPVYVKSDRSSSPLLSKSCSFERKHSVSNQRIGRPLEHFYCHTAVYNFQHS